MKYDREYKQLLKELQSNRERIHHNYIRSIRRAMAIGLIVVAITLLIVAISQAAPNSQYTPYPQTSTSRSRFNKVVKTYDQLADAIYHAEGGKNTNFPYGIKSVRCDSDRECRAICINTIRNNVRRFKQDNRGFSSYLEFLANRYAPVGVANDPTNLNRNWLRNVKYFLANPFLANPKGL
jgi:hypothetical protein